MITMKKARCVLIVFSLAVLMLLLVVAWKATTNNRAKSISIETQPKVKATFQPLNISSDGSDGMVLTVRPKEIDIEAAGSVDGQPPSLKILASAVKKYKKQNVFTLRIATIVFSSHNYETIIYNRQKQTLTKIGNGFDESSAYESDKIVCSKVTDEMLFDEAVKYPNAGFSIESFASCTVVASAQKNLKKFRNAP